MADDPCATAASAASVHGAARPRRLGVLVHRVSDWLHLLAHRLINDPEWKMRNG